MKLSPIALAAFAVLFFVGTAAARAGDPPAAITKAEAMHDKGQFKESLAVLDTYLAEHPKDARALADRGDDYDALGDPKSAAADYTAAIAVNPDYAYAYASRCDVRDELDQHTDALPDCDKAIALDPKMAYAYRARARVNINVHDARAALADANNAVSLDSDNAYGYELQCRAHIDLGQSDKAIDDCDEAIRVDPSVGEAYFQRGRADIDLKKWDAAIADFTQAEKLEPGPNGNYWLALARLNAGQYADGLKNIDVYIAAKADDGDGYYVRAQLQMKLGNAAEAKTAAQEALKQYRVDSDQSGIQQAQALIDSLDAPTGGAH